MIWKIEIQWWGMSRSRRMTIDIDHNRTVDYEENGNYEINGWTTFGNLSARGSSIQINLHEGVEDCWNMNKKLGIRQIRMYGSYVDVDDKITMKKFVISKFEDVTSLPEAILMLQFLVKQID